MNDNQYREHCLSLLKDFVAALKTRTPELAEDDPLTNLIDGFEQLGSDGSVQYELAPALVNRLFTTYTELAPLLPRQLLWFFGGDCLHYMPDDEIARFQTLEEMRIEAGARGEQLNLGDAHAKLLNLQ